MNARNVTVAEGMELAVVEAGAGGRPLLFVHGHGGAKEDLMPWLDRLAERGWHAVACDLRGHGSSAKPEDESEYSFDILTADLLALADQLGWQRFTLFGHSMGGMVAQVLALKCPERLDALILMDTSHTRPDRVEPAAAELGQQVVRQGGTALLVELQKSAGPSPTETAAHLRMIAEDPSYDEWSTSKTLAMAAAAWAGLVRDIVEQPDRLDRLKSLHVPTLVIVGEQDLGFLPQSRAIAAAIPGARLEVVAGAGHSPQFESPEAWWTALTAFLDGRPA